MLKSLPERRRSGIFYIVITDFLIFKCFKIFSMEKNVKKTFLFRIGIRAYDINTPEGSFVMLDNIMYGASLCKVGCAFLVPTELLIL